MKEPLHTYETDVKPEWIDEYGHMNVAHYITVCDQATYGFWRFVNAGRELEQRDGHEYAVLETHVHYLDEVVEGDPVHVTTQLLAHDDKRFILFHRMWRTADSALSATNEVKGLGFNLPERKIEIFLPEVLDRLEKILDAHRTLEPPEQAGQGIVLKKR
jgi:acyl-CoA thioester hydrolase